MRIKMTVPHVSGDDSQYLRKENIAIAHRQGLTDCPWCGFEAAEPDKHSMEQYDVWYKLPWIKEVVLNGTYYKRGCCVVVSSCPKCGKLSWLHRELDGMSDLFFPDSYDKGERTSLLTKPLNKEAIWGEVHKRGMENVKEMLSAICHKCEHFRGIKKTYDTFWSYEMICARDEKEKERVIRWFQKPDDCNAFHSSEGTTKGEEGHRVPPEEE